MPILSAGGAGCLVCWSPAILVSSLLNVASCVVREDRRVARPGACPGGVWIEGHYGPRGRWHPPHWRCPGHREVIEID